MYLQQEIRGQRVNVALGEALASGGEARIFSLRDHTDLVAKVYHTPARERSAKLAVMLAHPPSTRVEGTTHHSIAWPLHALRRDSSVVGFVMPRARGMRPVFEFYNPKTRREQMPQFNWLYLHRVARNLAAAVTSLHAAGYVIGDVNESNILVSDRALVTLVDTDSFQVREPGTDRIYRCLVGKPEFTPPELQGKLFAEVMRTVEHDLFGLGVILFQLLMEGTHPFAGRFTGAGDPPPYEERIQRGHFPYAAGLAIPYEPMPHAPPHGILHPGLAGLFERCFVQGHHRPELRPTAEQWQKAIAEAEAALAVCSRNRQHRFGWHLSVCPWCERTAHLKGRDPFPPPGTRPKPAPARTSPARKPQATPRPRPVRLPAAPSNAGPRTYRSGGRNWGQDMRFGWLVLWIIFVMVRTVSCDPPRPATDFAADTQERANRFFEDLRRQNELRQKRDEESRRLQASGLFNGHSFDASGNCTRCGWAREFTLRLNRACIIEADRVRYAPAAEEEASKTGAPLEREQQDASGR